MSQVNVKVWREDKEVSLPTYGHYEDACCDLYVKDVEYDNKKDMYIVHTGLHVEIPIGYEMEIRPRSSNTKTEFYIPNSPCTVDAPYRGEIQIRFRCRTAEPIINKINEIINYLNTIKRKDIDVTETNVMKRVDNEDARTTLLNCIDKTMLGFLASPQFPYNKGDRCAQLLVRKRERVAWIEVENENDLLPSDRGDGGFGSTGK